MPNTPRSALAMLTLAVALAGCSGGQGANDTLADGAGDRPTGGNSESAAEDVGPPTVPATAAGPAAARTGADATTGGPTAPGAGSPATGAATLVMSSQGAHGPHITDAAGNALYQLEGDRDGSKCTGDCLTAWPPVLVGAARPSGGAGLQGAMIASVARPEGGQQVAYNGHPLYRYAADGGAGNTNGHGVKDKYGTWYLVSPQGTPVAGSHAGH